MITFAVSFTLADENVGEITIAGDAEASGGPVTDKPYTSMHGDFMNGWEQAELRTAYPDLHRHGAGYGQD